MKKAKKQKKSYKVRNVPPGTMSYRGKKSLETTQFEILSYDKDVCTVVKSDSVEEVLKSKENNKITWINVNGLNNISEIEKLSMHYNMHPLTMEDVVNTNHRPKLDEFDDYLFVVLRMLHFKEDETLINEHLSIVTGKNHVLTFQEADGDVFDGLRARITTGKGKIRTMGADYLMYSLMDAVVDNYLTVVEVYGDRIEELEDAIFNETSDVSGVPGNIQLLKRDILKIRRSVVPLREVINRLDKLENPIITEKTGSYIRDLYDHIVSVNESIDLYREMIWSLMDMYMSIISNKMNEVMKVLTIIATIFIPLTFIAGIYGMNFDNMPELHYEYGYFILLIVMAVIFVLMLLYFKKKKWI